MDAQMERHSDPFVTPYLAYATIIDICNLYIHKR